MKNYQKIIISVVLPLLSLCSCARHEEVYVDRVDFHSELQSNYLKDIYNNISPYASGKEELSKPKGYMINFNNPDHIYYVVSLKSNIDNRDYVTDKELFNFNNLYLNTKYTYEVKKDGKIDYQGEFVTNDVAPRNIDVQGVTNFRDLGGHPTIRGTYTKQGMIYRSAKFNVNEGEQALITDKGRDTVIDELKIKSEIDLRLIENNENGGITTSVIDPLVNYYSIPMRYDGTFLEINEKAIKDLFDIVSIKDNYPFVFHCSIGTDRTGMVGFIFNALLEVRVESIYRDYLFSNFGFIGGSRNTGAIDTYIATLNNYRGDTLKEQCISYLNSIGVENNKIESFLDIMEA